MFQISSIVQRNKIAIVLLTLHFIGIFINKVLMSNGMIWLVGLCFLPIEYWTRTAKNDETLLNRIKSVFSYPPFYILMAIPLIALLSLLNTTNYTFGFASIIMYSPFLFMPFAFGALRPFSKKEFITLLYSFISITVLVCIYTAYIYILDFHHINEQLKQGQALPTINNEHIRFSLSICFSICALGYILFHKWYVFHYKKERIIQICIMLFLIICLHFFAVRSGLLAFYLCLIYISIYIIFSYKKYVFGIIMLLLCFCLPFLTYHYVESVKNKVNYMLWDMNQLNNSNISNYSDAVRIASIRSGVELIKEHPLIGVGIGDIKEETYIVLKKTYPAIEPKDYKMPHNQWVWSWASMGIAGPLLLLISIVVALLYNQNYKNLLLLCFFIISISSFLYEHTLQTQIGVSFYIMPMMILLNYLRGNNTAHANRL